MEHYCKECENSNGNDTCTLTGAHHDTGIECPSFKQKENEMFKVGDKVRVVADEKRLKELYIPDRCKLTGVEGVLEYVNKNSVRVNFDNTYGNNWSLNVGDLELVETPTEAEPERTFVGDPDGVLKLAENPDYYGQLAEETQYVEIDLAVPEGQPSIRTFGTGATRDTDQGKLDYVKALSPIVIRRYVQYLDKHRKQSDGSYRDFDNWKKGIPVEAYISGNGRHFMDTWLLTEGYATEDNHGPVEIEDAICAQLFNLMGRLHEILKEGFDYQAAIDHETGDDGTGWVGEGD